VSSPLGGGGVSFPPPPLPPLPAAAELADAQGRAAPDVSLRQALDAAAELRRPDPRPPPNAGAAMVGVEGGGVPEAHRSGA